MQALPGEAQGGGRAGSGTRLTLVQGVHVLVGDWLTEGNSIALQFYVFEWCNVLSLQSSLGSKQHPFLLFLRKTHKTISLLCFWSRSKFPGDSFFVCL